MKRGGLVLILGAGLAVASAQGGETITVPDSIRAEGVPGVPAKIRGTLERYQNIRSATFQDWDSTGEGAYILTRFADVPQVHQVSTPGAARTQLTFLPERILSVAARPRHDQFLYLIDEGGGENYQLFLQDRSGGSPRRITDGKSRNTSPVWSPSGDLLAWSSNARNGKDMDLYLASPADPSFVRRFKEVKGEWTVSDWSPDEKKVVAVEYISINVSYIHVIEIDTGNVETLTPKPSDSSTDRVSNSSPKWTKDGTAIFYITDQGSEFRSLAVHLLDSRKTKSSPIVLNWDTEEFDISNELIAFITNEDGISRLRVARLDTWLKGGADTVELPEIPDGVITGLKFHPDADALGFTLSAARFSSDVYSIGGLSSDPPTTLYRWTVSETGGLDPNTFAEPRLIRFPTFDKREIPAFVYRPPASKFPGRRPVLINIHGGPESQFRPIFLGRVNSVINELGLVVIFPNVRGSDGYGKTSLKLDNGKLREDSVKDIGALLDWIEAQPDLDSKRVGVIGGSYGGYMSLAVQTNYNSRIKAGIDIVGISNFVTFLKNTQGYRRDLRRAEYGDERDPDMREFLERISPLTNAGKIKTPILVVQGANDPRVPLSEAEQIVKAIKANDIPVWYVVGKNEGHGFAKKINQDYLHAVEVMFLKRFLLGDKSQ
jgi:dipeptidyl aminopeptidase/acylaminoacyl peptidase